MTESQPSPPAWYLAKPYRYFYSLRLGLVLLLLLTVASIYGTLISPLSRAQELVFYSKWYLALLGVTALNITAATIFTLATKILPSSKPRFMEDARFYDTALHGRQIDYGGPPEAVEAAFRRQGFRVWRQGAYGYAARGRLSRWGAPVSHLGVVIVLLGGFLSAIVAREGQVVLVEGEATRRMKLMPGLEHEIDLGFTLQCDDFKTGFFPRTNTPSHFTSHITAFVPGVPPRSDFVEVNRSMHVQGWQLHQTSYQEIKGYHRYRLVAGSAADGIATATLDLTPGQTRAIPGAPGFEIALSRSAPYRWTLLREGQGLQRGTLDAPAGSLVVLAEQFEPDFVIGENRIATSRSQALNNPALRVTLSENGHPVVSQWLFARDDMKGMVHHTEAPYELEFMAVKGEGPARRFVVAVRTHEHGGAGLPLGELELALGQPAALEPATAAAPDGDAGEAAIPATGPWSVRFIETTPLFATVLTLSRNPALPLVYAGCVIMMAGLAIAFGLRRREVWFWVDARRGRLRVAATYPQPRESLDRATQRALESLAAKETK